LVISLITGLTVAQASPQRLLDLNHGHRSIENCLHNVRDVSLLSLSHTTKQSWVSSDCPSPAPFFLHADSEPRPTRAQTLPSPPFGDLHLSPSSECFTRQKQIAHPFPMIFPILLGPGSNLLGKRSRTLLIHTLGILFIFNQFEDHDPLRFAALVVA
jgi:hypothetical protein